LATIDQSILNIFLFLIRLDYMDFFVVVNEAKLRQFLMHEDKAGLDGVPRHVDVVHQRKEARDGPLFFG